MAGTGEQAVDYLLVDSIVVGHEDTQWRKDGRHIGHGWLLGACQRGIARARGDGEAKQTTLARGAADRDAASQKLAEPPAEGEAKSAAAITAGDRTVGLCEVMEQRRNNLGLNANSGVLDFKFQQQ